VLWGDAFSDSEQLIQKKPILYFVSAWRDSKLIKHGADVIVGEGLDSVPALKIVLEASKANCNITPSVTDTHIAKVDYSGQPAFRKEHIWQT
jgi:hypothetical protein